MDPHPQHATTFTVTLASQDEIATRRLLGDGLGLDRDDAGRHQLGDVLLEVTGSAGGRRTGPVALTVGTGDVQTLTKDLHDAGHPVDEAGNVGNFHGIAVRIAAGPAPVAPVSSANVLGLDHIGVATDDSASLVAAFGALGFLHESRQIDTQLQQPMEIFSSDRHGVVTHAGTPVQAGALLVTFLRHGSTDIELLEDIMSADGRNGDGPGSTTGDNRAIARFVARNGNGLHHLAIRVREMDAGLARLRDAGIALLDARGRPGSRRSSIAFVDRRTTGGLVLHLVQRP